MYKYALKISIFTTTIAIFCINSLGLFVPVIAQNNSYLRFDPNYIISNQTFRSFRDFPDAKSVQNFLDKKNSVLKNYSDKGLKASDIIFQSATGLISSKNDTKPRLSPALLLTLLEKEQSLVSTTNYNVNSDPEKKISSAMGYACPDTNKCDPNYQGFYNQVTSAAFQLQYNYDNSYNPGFLPFNVNNTTTTSDGFSVKISNEASASLYRYTPHVFWGNYNVFKIMIVNQWTINKYNTNYDEVDRANNDLINTFKNKKNQTKATTLNIAESSNLTSNSCSQLYQIRYTIGQEGNNIKNLQQCLRDAKYFTFPSNTGYFGNITSSALVKYLNDTNQCPRFLYKNFKIGTSSNEITSLQNCLINANLFPLVKPTSYYGPITNEALSKYKR
jgi:hypothetical protein